VGVREVDNSRLFWCPTVKNLGQAPIAHGRKLRLAEKNWLWKYSNQGIKTFGNRKL
jgi:hypothetical protein